MMSWSSNWMWLLSFLLLKLELVDKCHKTSFKKSILKELLSLYISIKKMSLINYLRSTCTSLEMFHRLLKRKEKLKIEQELFHLTRELNWYHTWSKKENFLERKEILLILLELHYWVEILNLFLNYSKNVLAFLDNSVKFLHVIYIN